MERRCQVPAAGHDVHCPHEAKEGVEHRHHLTSEEIYVDVYEFMLIYRIQK